MHREMQTFLESIASELGTTMVQKKDMPGMMFVEYEPSRIEGPLLAQQNSFRYPDLDSRFLTMLHELGHVDLGHTQGRPPYSDKTFYFDNGVLRSEAEAWNYALTKYAEFTSSIDRTETPSTSSRKFMWETCLGSYYRGAQSAKGQPSRLRNGNRAYVEFTYDEPDNYFWAIKKKILND